MSASVWLYVYICICKYTYVYVFNIHEYVYLHVNMCIHAHEDIPASCTQPNVCIIFFKYESMYAIMYSKPV